MYRITVLIFAALFLLAACGRDNGDTTERYDNDGYLGITQTNPHLPTNPSAQSYYEDQEVIRRTLMNIDGVKQVYTISSGTHAYIYLTLEQELSKAEREEIRAAAEQALRYNHPHENYTVRLR